MIFIIICNIILYIYICILNKGDVCGDKVGGPACMYMLCGPGHVTAAKVTTAAAAEAAADACPRIPVPISTN